MIPFHRNKRAELLNTVPVDSGHVNRQYYNSCGVRYVRCRTLLTLLRVAPVGRDVTLAGKLPKAFGVLVEGISKLMENNIQLSGVRGGYGLSTQLPYAIF
ncbi:MAG: hypothetical protein WB952_06145 [Terriglobales bacterium]